MNQNTIPVSSITYAIKGRDLLRSMGFRAYIERSKGQFEQSGCGYSIVVNENSYEAREVLRKHNIKMVDHWGGSS